MAPAMSIRSMAIICVALLWYSPFLFAQTEILPVQFEQDTIRLKKYNLYDDLSTFPLSDARGSSLFNTAYPELNSFQSVYQFSNKLSPKTFLVSFNESKTVMPGLGTTEHFTGQLRWNPGKNVTVDFRSGLAIQNTIMNPYVPNYQLSFRALVEYTFNDWLSAYLYAQFISKPLNRSDDYFDPFMSNNPLFLQNEIGAGLKASFNKTYIGLEIYSMPVHEFKPVSSNPANSRIVIGF